MHERGQRAKTHRAFIRLLMASGLPRDRARKLADAFSETIVKAWIESKTAEELRKELEKLKPGFARMIKKV